MDKSQDYPDIPGAKEYYGEVIAPSKLIERAYEVLERQYFSSYGGRGYSSERTLVKVSSKEEAEAIALAKMQEKDISAPFFYSVREVK